MTEEKSSDNQEIHLDFIKEYEEDENSPADLEDRPHSKFGSKNSGNGIAHDIGLELKGRYKHNLSSGNLLNQDELMR